MSSSFKKENDYIIDSLSEEIFDFDETINYTKEILSDLNDLSEYTTCEFENDEWCVYEPVRKSSLHFHFSELDKINTSSSGIKAKTYFKCWVAERISSSSIPHSYSNYNNVLRTIKYTNFFDINRLNDFIYHLEHELNYVDETKIRFVNSILNFISYVDEIDENSNYTKELLLLRSKFKTKDVIRTLPKSQDILKFSWSIDHFIRKNNLNEKENTHTWIRFFPVIIWWKLTTVIPIRASEFCDIKKNCLIKKENECWIKLPRKKQSQAKTVELLEVEDTIKISQEIYDMIQSYIDLTIDYKDSDTLISYSWLLKHGYGNNAKKNKFSFALNNFRTLLNSFYEEYVFEDHKDFPINDLLKPNDTRHLSFLSLLMQGVHPVEIARLGGHSDIKAQYHYHQHQEYWVDSEVEKLMSSFDLQGSSFQLNKADDLKSTTLDMRFKLLALLKTPVEESFKKLSIGYCTDELQRCQTDCFFCPFWKISKEEFNEKSHEIDQKRKEVLSNIDDLTSFLRNIHQNILSDGETEFHPIYERQLKTTSNKIKDEIYKLSKIKFITEGEEND